MKKFKFRALPLLLCAALVLTSGAALAATGGSKTDPLITLSYLKEKVIPDILDQFDEVVRPSSWWPTFTISAKCFSARASLARRRDASIPSA